MKTKYFSNSKTIAEIKSEYRKFAMQHHPDRGGDTATMQEINAEYHAALKALNGEKSYSTYEGKKQEHTYTYNNENETAIMEKISELCSIPMDDVIIDLIGLWIWVRGETKPHKEVLKKIDMQWNHKRDAWYWKPYEGRGKYSKRDQLDDLATKYGSTKFKTAERLKVSA